MTSLGLILTIIIGVFALSEVNVPQYFDLLLVVIFCILSITTILCLFCCLKIIQSDEICPPGNDGLELLGDASDKFSEHEENVDYILVLSESRHRNEALIKRNAKLLMLASRYFFITVVLVFFASGVISLFSA